MTDSFRSRYAALVAAQEIEADPGQIELAAWFTRLEARLVEYRLARKSSSLGWMFNDRRRSEAPVKGLYIYGDVGRGKTMLMDLFFAASRVRRKWRVHFHEFMTEVHERVHGYRQRLRNGELAGEDPIELTAAAIADQAWLLCFDEFHVTDIADAMILGRLFTRLFDHGVIVVATSNIDPGQLYQGGLNRALFLPFIALLRERMDVVRLDARTDFRLEKFTGVQVWHVPADTAAKAALDDAWRKLTHGHEGAARELVVRGHIVRVPQAARGVARFSFHDLCQQPLGANDYLKIAHEFHTIVLDRIPVMSYAARNEAKRFIALIDTLYDNAVKLVASAAAAPSELYTGTQGYEAQEFNRTASRLIEMGSKAYLGRPHGRAHAKVSASSEGLVET